MFHLMMYVYWFNINVFSKACLIRIFILGFRKVYDEDMNYVILMNKQDDFKSTIPNIKFVLTMYEITVIMTSALN